MVESDTSVLPVYQRFPLLPSLLFPLGWSSSPYWLSSGQLQVFTFSSYNLTFTFSPPYTPNIPGHLGSCGLLECGSHMSSPTPVWLLGSSNPIELTSPNFPNAFNAANLECEWVVKPRFGTKVNFADVKSFIFFSSQVKVTFVTVDMGSDCQSNALEVTDTSKGGALSYPGLQVCYRWWLIVGM